MKSTSYIIFVLLSLCLFSCSQYIANKIYGDPNIKQEDVIALKNLGVQLLNFDERIPRNAKFQGTAQIQEFKLDGMIAARKMKADIIKRVAFHFADGVQQPYHFCKMYKSANEPEDLSNENYTKNEKEVLKTLTAYRKGYEEYYEFDGYLIDVYEDPKKYNYDVVKRLESLYNISSDISSQASKAMNAPHSWYAYDNIISEDLRYHTNTFIFGTDENRTQVVRMATPFTPNVDLMQAWLDMYLGKRIPEDHFTRFEISKIDLLGKTIVLKDECQRLTSTTLDCSNKTKIGLSRSSTEKLAKDLFNAKMMVSLQQTNGKIIWKEDRDVLFLGEETKALYTKIEFPRSANRTRDERILNSYALVRQDGDEFLHFNISHYGNTSTNESFTENMKQFLVLK